MSAPTTRQFDALRFICDQILERRLPPSLGEIGAHLGIGKTAARLLVRGLQRRSLILDHGGKSRALAVSEQGWAATGSAPPLAPIERGVGMGEEPRGTAVLGRPMAVGEGLLFPIVRLPMVPVDRLLATLRAFSPRAA